MTNPASQQPAPIPEDLKDQYTLAAYDDEPAFWGSDVRLYIERIARLEAALRKVQEKTSPHEGGVNMISKINAIARAALSTPLGTPGKGEKSRAR